MTTSDLAQLNTQTNSADEVILDPATAASASEQLEIEAKKPSDPL